MKTIILIINHRCPFDVRHDTKILIVYDIKKVNVSWSKLIANDHSFCHIDNVSTDSDTAKDNARFISKFAFALEKKDLDSS